MLDVNDARINSGRQFGFLPHAATPGFDPHPLSVGDSEARCRFRVDFRDWIALSFTKLFELTMFRVEKE